MCVCVCVCVCVCKGSVNGVMKTWRRNHDIFTAWKDVRKPVYPCFHASFLNAINHNSR